MILLINNNLRIGNGPVDNPLLSKTQEYTHHNFCVIPVDSEKRPVLYKGEVEGRRGRIAKPEELTQFFGGENGKTRTWTW